MTTPSIKLKFDDKTESKESNSENQNFDEKRKMVFSQHPWLLGLLGSDVMLVLLFITLFKAKRLVPAEDYREMRGLWLGITVPTIFMSIVVFIFEINPHAQLVCRVISIFSSCWLFFLMMNLREDGYVRQMVLPGKARSVLSAMLVGSIFFAIGMYLLTRISFETGYEVVTTMLASILSFFSSSLLFKMAYVAKTKELK